MSRQPLDALPLFATDDERRSEQAERDERMTSSRDDFRTMVARNKLGLSSEWETFKWEAIGDYKLGDSILSLGVPRLLKSGGRP